MRRKSRTRSGLRVLSSRVAFRGDGVGSVHETRLRFPSGAVRTWTYLIKSPFVMVLAVQGNRLVLVRQRRYPQGQAWEVIKGGIERREAPMSAAKRELREETGFTARRWRRLARLMVAPGYFNQTGYVYLAQGLHAGVAQPETNGEMLKVVMATPARVRSLLAQGGIYDSVTMAGLLLARKYFPL
ncbi:MAG: NUDIX hydrolase [bacterium]|nr:NUDIX hydrolase [bacterium]